MPPKLNIHIGTHPFRTLINTGTQVSLVSETFFELSDSSLVKSIPNPIEVTLLSATGHALEASRVVRIRITIGKARMYHDFIVVKNFNHDMLLGIDFLNARKALLDFDSQTLIIESTVCPLKTKPGQEKS